MQVDEDLDVLKNAIEALEGRTALLESAPPYAARAALSPETLTDSGTTSWANVTGKRLLASFDFQLVPQGGFGVTVNMKVAGALVQQFFSWEGNKPIRMGASVIVASGEQVVFELAGGGGVKLEGVHVSYRPF